MNATSWCNSQFIKQTELYNGLWKLSCLNMDRTVIDLN